MEAEHMSDRTWFLTIPEGGGYIVAPDWPAIASLYTKISATMAALESVDKDATHGLHYQYTSWDEAAAALRKAMAAAGLALTAHMAASQADADGTLVTIHLTLADTTTGAMKVLTWQASGADVTKASTSAVKHCLSKSFLMSADHDADHPPTPARGRAPRAAAAPPAPAGRTVDPATGEISAPAAPADLTSDLLAAPSPGATVGAKRQWIHDMTSAAGWTPKQLQTWLKRHRAAYVGDLTDAALDAAVADLDRLLTLEP